VKQAVVLLALSTLVLMIEGAIAAMVPVRFVPDLGLLLVLAFALSVRNPTAGVLLAAYLGFVTDVFSGALLGQNVLLSIVLFGISRFSGARLNLRGAIPQALFAAGLCVFQSGALWALTVFFAAGSGVGLVRVGDVVPYALMTALVAPPVCEGVAKLVARLGDDDGGGRLLDASPTRFGL
jgi:rod shape-determining protein MreD